MSSRKPIKTTIFGRVPSRTYNMYEKNKFSLLKRALKIKSLRAVKQLRVQHFLNLKQDEK